MDAFLLSQYVLSGVVIGVIYSLMALGITFIYSIMKMINWGMGEFYMIGSYVQYALIVNLVGPPSLVAGPAAGDGVRVRARAWSSSGSSCGRCSWAAIERRDEYATIVTIALMVFFRNLAIVLGGPNQYAPPDYARPVTLGTLPISGNRFVALIGTARAARALLSGDQEDVDRAGRCAARRRTAWASRRRASTCFAWTCSRSAWAWRWPPPPARCWRPDFLVYPENGAISTFKGFEIIVIGGLGSILGSIVGGVLLGVIEALGSVFISAAYKDLYGFLLLIALLVFRPTGLFGERERTV